MYYDDRHSKPCLGHAPACPFGSASASSRFEVLGGAVPDLSAVGEVRVLDLGADENRFNPAWVGAVDALLDEVENADGPRGSGQGAR